jgi:hypothetical protein
MSADQWEQIQNLGIGAVLVSTFLVALLRGTIVLGRELRDMREDRNFWRGAATRMMNQSGTALTIAERTSSIFDEERTRP